MKSKIFFLIVCIAVFFASIANSAPLKNYPVTMTQPDGSKISCFVTGDEFYHRIHDANNYTIIKNTNTGYFVYAALSNDVLISTGYIVGKTDPTSTSLVKGVDISSAKISSLLKSSPLYLSKTSAMQTQTTTAISGTINNLTIFIRFQGENEYTDSKSLYNDLFNKSTANVSSMVNYFKEVSYNQLTTSTTFYPTTALTTVVSYQDSHARSYFQPYDAVTNTNGYQGGDDGSERYSREATLLANAVNSIKSQVSTSLNIDNDNDGYVDNVCFIVSGNVGGWGNLLWPHRYYLGSQSVYINGKMVDNYNFQLQGNVKGTGNGEGVGVLCHEMGHTVGFPDLYHYSNNGLNPVGGWDIMADTYNPPQHMGAYMKMRYTQWIASIPEIKMSGTYSLSPLTSSANNCYKIKSPNPGKSSEYFVVEYRKKTGIFESSLLGQGLIIYRINTNQSGAGNQWGPPDEIYVYRPGGTLTNDGNSGSANYTSDAGRTSFSNTTNPTCFLSDGSDGEITLSNVSACGSTISFFVAFRKSLDVTNNFTTSSSNNGRINVSVTGGVNGQVDCPYRIRDYVNKNIAFTAVNGQTDNNGIEMVWNNNIAPNSVSAWSKLKSNYEFSYVGGNNISYSFTPTTTDDALYTANLRKYFSIVRNDQSTEFGTNLNSVSSRIVEGNILTAPLTQTVGSNTYCFTSWSDGVTQNTRTINSSTSPLTSQYKGVHLSNTSTAFSNNSQRKLVQTKDGWLHQVYESTINGVGHVWLEHSTDNGTTWFLGNNGQPLDNDGGKCPSIDWHCNSADPNNAIYYAVIVAYQQPSGSTYTIEYAVFKNASGSYVRQGQDFAGPLYTEPAGGDQYSTTNANPNIAWGESYIFALSFERKSTAGGMQPGIYWIYGSMYEGGVEHVPGFPTAPQLIAGTTSSSTNATISLNKQIVDNSLFDIVYQTGTGAGSNIRDVILSCYSNGSSFIPSQVYASTISSGSGYVNYKPSMVQMPDTYIRVCWIRDMYGSGSGAPNYVNAVYWNSASPSVFNYSGNMVNSVSLNIKDGTSNTYFAYAQNTNNSNWQNFASNGSSTISLSATGQHIQLSNGPSSSAMNASSYYPSSLPYYFLNNSLGSLAKSSSEEFTYGRGIALIGTGFFYSLKSLTVDKSNIRFAEIPEGNDVIPRRRGMQYVTLDSLNTLLISEPFTVGEGTSFTFSDDGGFTDSSAVQEVLGKKGYISCKLELIDDATGKTLGVMKESKFSLSSSFRGNLSTSRLNLKGTGTKNVRAKITVGSNVDSLNGVWVNEYGTVNDEMLGKISINELDIQKSAIVTEYALEQNYPNPFNPSTTIRYQLPNAGHVTLKVYDMLGREVATLVDEMKETGYYSATFDGARLASGMYIMRLTTQSEEGKSFIKTKKMMLLK